MTTSTQTPPTNSGTGRRVALVTGGSGGIGRAVAEKLGGNGMAVGVHYAGNRDRAQETADAVTAAGGEATLVSGDIADEAAVAAMFDEVEAAYGGIDVVINTAGIMLLLPLAELDLSEGGDFDRMQRTNVRGTFVVTQQAARRVRPGGAIVNFSTSVVKLALPTYSAYNATKGAVEAMTMILAREMRGRDVTVNTVAPGRRPRRCSSTANRRRPSTPWRKCPRWSASASPRTSPRLSRTLPARWVNGQVIYVNGGVA